MLKYVSVLLFVGSVVPSPFQLTDQYIAEFKTGVENLKKLVNEYDFKEDSFDGSLYNETEALTDASEYDFVVIGAGGAGAVVASRLSEIPEWKVLVLEAGGPETPYTQIPAIGSSLQHSPYNWAYVTTPQKNWCKGMIDNQCAIAAGKILGGSTSVNGMIYTRGNAKDYDLWADLGNDGWCYNDVLPYFKKAEDADLEHFDHDFHNRGGPFHIEHPQHLSEVPEHVLSAAKELGYNTVDYNGKEQIGFSIPQINSKHGKRESTNQAYLEPAKKRPNLTIKPLSHVIKIIISPHTKEATGVEYLHDGKLYIAKARKEVILSAGTFNTPQLLMLSGIGPKEELEKFEIPVVADLPVGHNLKDHVAFIGLDFIFNSTESDEGTDEILQYLKDGKGPLTSPGIETLGYIQTEASKDTTKYPDVELIFIKKKISGSPGHNPFRIKKEVFEGIWKPVEGEDCVSVAVMVTHPKSTGVVKLQDKDPLHHPIIDLNQLSDPDDHDLKTIIAGIHKVLALSETETIKKLGVTLNDNPIPGCEGHKFGTDDYWKCAIKHLSISLRHVTGTARMGPSTDKEAVVDNKLKVYGVHKLRVVDNSVIPVTITGHTMAAAIMIGEKASDLIKADWK